MTPIWPWLSAIALFGLCPPMTSSLMGDDGTTVDPHSGRAASSSAPVDVFLSDLNEIAALASNNVDPNRQEGDDFCPQITSNGASSSHHLPSSPASIVGTQDSDENRHSADEPSVDQTDAVEGGAKTAKRGSSTILTQLLSLVCIRSKPEPKPTTNSVALETAVAGEPSTAASTAEDDSDDDFEALLQAAMQGQLQRSRSRFVSREPRLAPIPEHDPMQADH